LNFEFLEFMDNTRDNTFAQALSTRFIGQYKDITFALDSTKGQYKGHYICTSIEYKTDKNTKKDSTTVKNHHSKNHAIVNNKLLKKNF